MPNTPPTPTRLKLLTVELCESRRVGLHNSQLFGDSLSTSLNSEVELRRIGGVNSERLGVATGVYGQKSAQVNFLWGKNDTRTAIQQF